MAAAPLTVRMSRTASVWTRRSHWPTTARRARRLTASLPGLPQRRWKAGCVRSRRKKKEGTLDEPMGEETTTRRPSRSSSVPAGQPRRLAWDLNSFLTGKVDENAMHAILATIGTDGGVFPYLGLGESSRAEATESRWRRTNPFERVAVSITVFAAFSLWYPAKKLAISSNNPDTWHPLKGPGFLARWGARLIRRQYGVFSQTLPTPMGTLYWPHRPASSPRVWFRKKCRGRWRPSSFSRG